MMVALMARAAGEGRARLEFITAVFVLTAVSLFGTPPDQQPSRICLFVGAARTEEANEIRSIVVEELTHQIEKSGFAMIPEQILKAQLSGEELASLELLQSSTAVEVAKRIDADVALLGSVQVVNRDIILRMRGYDAFSGDLVFSREERQPADIGIYNTVSSLSRALVDSLSLWAGSQPGKDGLPQVGRPQNEASGLGTDRDMQRSPELKSPPAERVLESEAPGEDAGQPAEEEMATEPVVSEQPSDLAAGKIRITLLSHDEGAQVCLEPDQRLGTIQNGQLVVELPANTQLAIETTKPGYHANREYFEVDDQPAEIRIAPLLKQTRIGFELFYTSSQFLGIGAGFRLYVIPDSIMFKADDYVYFSLSSEGDDSTPAFHNDFRVQFGSYLLSPPGRRVRFGVSTGAGVIVSVLGKADKPAGTSAYYDFYWDLVDLWLDYNWRKTAVFFKVETKYALGLGRCLLERDFVAQYGPQFTVGWLLKF